MGLRERQLLQTLQTQDQAMADSLVRDITHGGTLEWRIDWDSFATTEAALRRFREPFWGHIPRALELAAADIGALELRRHIKAVVVKNHAPPFKSQCQCEQGVLSIAGAWGAEPDPYYRGHPHEYPSDSEMARAIVQDYRLNARQPG